MAASTAEKLVPRTCLYPPKYPRNTATNFASVREKVSLIVPNSATSEPPRNFPWFP